MQVGLVLRVPRGRAEGGRRNSGRSTDMREQGEIAQCECSRWPAHAQPAALGCVWWQRTAQQPARVVQSAHMYHAPRLSAATPHLITWLHASVAGAVEQALQVAHAGSAVHLPNCGAASVKLASCKLPQVEIGQWTAPGQRGSAACNPAYAPANALAPPALATPKLPTWSPSLLVMNALNQLKGRHDSERHRPAAAANSSSPGECSTLAVSFKSTSCKGWPHRKAHLSQVGWAPWPLWLCCAPPLGTRHCSDHGCGWLALKRPWFPVTKKASSGTRSASQWCPLPISRYQASLHALVHESRLVRIGEATYLSGSDPRSLGGCTQRSVLSPGRHVQ